MFVRLALFLMLLSIPAACGATPVVVNHINIEGRWIIESYYFDGISAMSEAEAKAYVGRDVFISAEVVRFADLTCKVTDFGVEKIAEDELDLMGEDPDYPYGLGFSCSNDVVIPGFSVGNTPDEIRASLDGGSFVLKRK